MRYQFILSIIILLTPSLVSADHAGANFETGTSGAIMTSPGATLTKGKLVLGVGVQFLDLDEISDERLEALGDAEEEVHSIDSLLNVSANIVYGFTDDLTLGISLPYVGRTNIREAEHHMGSGEVENAGDSKGWGDLFLFGQYRFYHDEFSDIAIIAGLKTPTGKTSERELEGSQFEAEQQPGAGSWDPFFGLAYNRNWGYIGFSSNVLYIMANEGTQDTDLGDIFNYNLALTYRIFSPEGKHDHHAHAHGLGIIDYVDGILELNGEYRKHTVIGDDEEENTGGHSLYLSPGLRIGLGHQWSLYTSVGIPIINDLNGQQSEPDYRIIAGISSTF